MRCSPSTLFFGATMQNSRFQIGVITVLALGLGSTLSSRDAAGYPAGPSISYGSVPVISSGGTLNGTTVETPLTAPSDQALIITDVVLSASDSQYDCRGSVTVSVSDGSETLGNFVVGLGVNTYNYSVYQPISNTQLSSGIRIAPGSTLQIQSSEHRTWSCSGSGMEVQYTLSGYYAQP